jgi:hypothetical protein
MLLCTYRAQLLVLVRMGGVGGFGTEAGTHLYIADRTQFEFILATVHLDVNVPVARRSAGMCQGLSRDKSLGSNGVIIAAGL